MSEAGEGEEGEEGEEEWESEDSWESDLDSEAEIAELMQMDLVDDSANTGKQEYLAKCSELRIVPVAMFIAKLECEHINLRHHGMGVKGARALAAALLANSKIRSLNLGDNWFGDEGVHAVAEVFLALHGTARHCTVQHQTSSGCSYQLGLQATSSGCSLLVPATPTKPTSGSARWRCKV